MFVSYSYIVSNIAKCTEDGDSTKLGMKILSAIITTISYLMKNLYQSQADDDCVNFVLKFSVLCNCLEFFLFCIISLFVFL